MKTLDMRCEVIRITTKTYKSTAPGFTVIHLKGDSETILID
jgi:hypothetical protein